MIPKIFSFFIIVFFLPWAAQATTISPPVMEMELNPGENQEAAMKLYNETDNNLFLSGKIELFKPKGERGEVEILSDEITSEVLSWVKLPLYAAVLRPDETIRVPILVNIPKNAAVGGYYLAAMWESSGAPKDENSGVGISSRVGALILIKVKGEAKEELKILDFFSLGQPLFAENLAMSQKFYNHLSINFIGRLRNDGNIHLKPVGSVVIKNIFGRVINVLLFNQNKQNILPQSIRQFEALWQNNPAVKSGGFFGGLKNEITQFAFGRFSARLEIEYGEKRERLASPEIYFWVLPWRTILSAGIIVCLILAWRLGRKKKING